MEAAVSSQDCIKEAESTVGDNCTRCEGTIECANALERHSGTAAVFMMEKRGKDAQRTCGDFGPVNRGRTVLLLSVKPKLTQRHDLAMFGLISACLPK